MTNPDADQFVDNTTITRIKTLGDLEAFIAQAKSYGMASDDLILFHPNDATLYNTHGLVYPTVVFTDLDGPETFRFITFEFPYVDLGLEYPF